MGHDIIVVGTSAGGLDALRRLCSGLPADLPAAVLIVQHIAPMARSLLPDLLERAGPLPAAQATEGELIQRGRIYVAKPDFHLLVGQDGRAMVRRGPQENRTRPAVDPLFRSAAVACGPRVIGVVLSGMLDDGTAGLIAIKRCGGISVVQDPADAAWPSMPQNALLGDSVDYCVPVAEMAALLDRLSREPAGPPRLVPPELLAEARISNDEVPAMDEPLPTAGRPSVLSCPQCGGVLNEMQDGKMLRFRCQIGHAYGPEALSAAQMEVLEEALAVAVRTHRERVVLFRRMQASAAQRGLDQSAVRWGRAAEDAEQASQVITHAIEVLRASIQGRPMSAA